MAWVEPLNLEINLMNSFAGSIEIFILFAMLFIAGMAAFFRMNGQMFGVMILIFSIFMAGFYKGLYFLVILFAGLLIYYTFAKLVKN